MSNTLFLRLEGPLQAWGERARWSVRDTTTEPTKSGVVGLLGCALGLAEDKDLLELSRSLSMGVRCDREGVFLTDYHTIFGGILSAEGKIKRDTQLSDRTYLCDASFLVALQAEEGWIDRLSAAVQHPCWQVFLGRKSCVPTLPIYEGVGDFPSLISALQNWPYQGKASQSEQDLRVVIEIDTGEGVQRRDEVLSNSRRTFLPRYTLEKRILPVRQEEG